MLIDYHTAATPYQKLWLLQASKATAQQWISKHGTNSPTAADFQTLINNATSEIPAANKQLLQHHKLAAGTYKIINAALTGNEGVS